MLANALRWTSGKDSPTVGVENDNLGAWLREKGFATTLVKAADIDAGLTGVDVLVWADANLSEDRSRKLREWISAGHGLVCAQTGWGWQQIAGGRPMHENGLNHVLAPAGLSFTDGFAQTNGPRGKGFASEPPPPLAHGGRAIRALRAHASGAAALTAQDDLRLASASAVDAARALPRQDVLLRPLIETMLRESAGKLTPSEKSPLGEKHPLERFLLAFQLAELETLKPEEVRAHPSAASFPGVVPADATRIGKSVEIDTTVLGWHSLGLYAPPGEVLTVTIPESAAREGLSVRIGCHTDGLWHHRRWQRAPEISRAWRLSAGATRVASAFGGLVYIEVPKRAKDAAIQVQIAGAVESPLYVRGTTTAEDWKRIRDLPGPWAEFATRKVIITVPSSAIRTLDNPEPLMEFWDKVLDAAADLATIPRERDRPERYVPDVQISAGYMHSGYPIMTHLDAVDDLVGLSRLQKGAWGLYHELGHNHQSGDWTFDGTGEVTVNLFTMYILEKLCGVAPGGGHDAFKSRERTMGVYFARGAEFEQWKRDPFLALFMYCQLQEAFGWETFKRVFAEYRDLPQNERPRDEFAKRDQWMVRFSRACGKNLGPFFEAWGIPVTSAARRSIADLPEWMPEGFPPAPRAKVDAGE